MPPETQEAVNWALQQTWEFEGMQIPVSESRHALVDTVRYYFEAHNIYCPPMSAVDLEPYLPTDHPLRYNGS